MFGEKLDIRDVQKYFIYDQSKKMRFSSFIARSLRSLLLKIKQKLKTCFFKLKIEKKSRLSFTFQKKGHPYAYDQTKILFRHIIIYRNICFVPTIYITTVHIQYAYIPNTYINIYAYTKRLFIGAVVKRNIEQYTYYLGSK